MREALRGFISTKMKVRNQAKKKKEGKFSQASKLR